MLGRVDASLSTTRSTFFENCVAVLVVNETGAVGKGK